MISKILAYGYAALFGFSSCYSMFSEKNMPIWLFLLNITSVVLIALNPLGIIWLILGLILALVSAVLNGKIILGAINPIHFLIRLILSVVIVLLEVKKI
jgi:hypothetical protein